MVMLVQHHLEFAAGNCLTNAFLLGKDSLKQEDGIGLNQRQH